jgi:uncharacterized protein (DUF342 family)
MFSKKNSSDVIESDKRTAELFIDPLDENLTEYVLSSISGKKLYLTRLKDINVEPLIVKTNTPLFRFVSDSEADEEDKGSENQKKTIEIDPDFKYEDSKIEQSFKYYISLIDVLFIIENDRPKMIPVCKDGSAEVHISDDKMKVIVDIYPSVGDHAIPLLEEIVDKIMKLGVSTELDLDLLEEKVKDVSENKSRQIGICISKGKPAIHGKDGRLENCTKKREEIENFKFDEFHRVNPVISVKEGDTIAILHPPTEGEAGFDVFGKVIEPIPGKTFNLKIGTNTKFSEENGNHIIAKADGFVNLSDSSISITDTFTVHGDIDFKSGNIISKGSLKVTGNVKNEFTLSLSKDIEIGGYVGDAFVEAGQNIKVRGGFLGKGKGIMKSGGDMEVKFVENQQVFCRGSLTLLKETLNAKLYVKESIHSRGSSCSIIGGHVIAGESIEINNIGNSSESETIVEVGFDYLKRNSIMDNKEKQGKLREKLEEVDKQLFEFAKMKRMNAQLGEKVKLLVNEHKKLLAEIEEIKAANLKITSEIYVPTASKIIVKGTVYPGVKIGINGRFLHINNPVKSRTFVLSKEDDVVAC